MNPTPKTIQIFLPGGDPRGIRIAEITTRIVQVIELPRSLLQEFLKMPECNQVALISCSVKRKTAQSRRFTSGKLVTCAHASWRTTETRIRTFGSVR